MSRYLRILCLEADPAFRESLVDTLNLGEKSGHIGSAETWKRIRALRNVAAHESAPDPTYTRCEVRAGRPRGEGHVGV